MSWFLRGVFLRFLANVTKTLCEGSPGSFVGGLKPHGGGGGPLPFGWPCPPGPSAVAHPGRALPPPWPRERPQALVSLQQRIQLRQGAAFVVVVVGVAVALLLYFLGAGYQT